MKKTDLMRAVEKFDTEIAKHQQEIDSLQASKALLESVAQERMDKGSKKTKKSPAAGAKRAARAAKAAVSDNGSGSDVPPLE